MLYEPLQQTFIPNKECYNKYKKLQAEHFCTKKKQRTTTLSMLILLSDFGPDDGGTIFLWKHSPLAHNASI
jgi:hypothetical protein